MSDLPAEGLPADHGTPATSAGGGLVGGLLVAARPKHWVKNLLVVAAPVAAGLSPTGDVVASVLLAFVAMSLAASGTYLLNDVRDRAGDAAHPTKRHRPIASGRVTPAAATAVATVLLGLAVFAPVVAGRPNLAVVVAVYVAATTAYSLGLKRVAVLELAIVASGFVLRAIAGAVAVDVPVSRWFLIVVSAGAFHLVATKRYAESRDQAGAARRRVLDEYRGDLLAEIRFTTAAVMVAAYLLWAFEAAESAATSLPWFELSSVPFVLGLFRYTAAVHAGAGEAPEDVFLRDRQLLAYGAVWALVFALGVYGVGPAVA